MLFQHCLELQDSERGQSQRGVDPYHTGMYRYLTTQIVSCENTFRIEDKNPGITKQSKKTQVCHKTKLNKTEALTLTMTNIDPCPSKHQLNHPAMIIMFAYTSHK